MQLSKISSLIYPERHRAFTLVELMIALFVFGVVGAMVTVFVINSARSILWSVNKSKITSDFRHFTQQIRADAANADYVFMYSLPDIDQIKLAGRGSRLISGQTGEVLVLVDSRLTGTPLQRRIDSITFYYRETNPDDADKTAIFKSVVEFSGTARPLADPVTIDQDFEAILPGRNDIIDNSNVILENTKVPQNQNFFRIINNGRAVMINGEVLHGNNNQEITNTYNLTLTLNSML